MRCIHGWYGLFLIAVLFGWSSQPGPAGGQGKDVAKAAFDRIDLTSSGGFSGRGSGKAFSVDSKGKFTVKARGQQRQGELKPEELAQLNKRVAAVEWKAVKQSYQGKGADFFQDDLALTIGGKKIETHVSEDADRKQLPQTLRELLEYLDKLYNQYKEQGADK
jgi:hypothetical protein